MLQFTLLNFTLVKDTVAVLGDSHDLWFGLITECSIPETIHRNHLFSVYWFDTTTKANQFKLNRDVADEVSVGMLLGRVVFGLVVIIIYFGIIY